MRWKRVNTKENLKQIDYFFHMIKELETKREQQEEYIKLCETMMRTVSLFLQAWESEYNGVRPYLEFVNELTEHYTYKEEYEKAKQHIETLHELGLCTTEEKERKQTEIDQLEIVQNKLKEALRKQPGQTIVELEKILKEEEKKIFEILLQKQKVIKVTSNGLVRKVWLKEQDTTPVIEKKWTEEEWVYHKEDESEFPGWYVAIIANESTSKKMEVMQSYQKQSKKYEEVYLKSGKKSHKWIFTDEKESFETFLVVFEKIKGWKNCKYVIRGEVKSQKQIAEYINCFGGKQISKKENYCFGINEQLENPFGCHKIGLTNGGEPWWMFGYFDSGNVWHVDKREILIRLQESKKTLNVCPAFNWDYIMEMYENLPEEIDTNVSEEWERQGYVIRPKKKQIFW